jgi:hypothetical protein
MAIPRDSTKTQVNLDRNVYGSLPVEGLPVPDTDVDATFAYWHKDLYGSGQWVYARLQSGAGIDVDYDPDSGILSITNADYRKTGSFTADSYLAGRFTADSVLV